ncbi:MAG TPA: hypothetical protein VHN37_15285 [Actinomycetota bacterium]|nr:hypothetical protein [Actinomycetota bacterium]
MQRVERFSPSWILVLLGTSLLLGVLVPVNSQVALAVAVAVLALLGLAIPASSWVAAALFAALVARGVVTLGILPGAASFLDIPFAWGALGVALLRHTFGEARPLTGAARALVWGIGMLALAVGASFALNPSELARPVLYLFLLGEPFAVVAALLVEPPTRRGAARLRRLLFGLLVVQIPVVLAQIAVYGFTDDVKGTLHGAGAGHHAIGAVVIIGGAWIMLSDRPFGTRLFTSLPLFLIPFASDAKQVLFATPAALVFQHWGRGAGRKVALFGVVGLLAVIMFRFYGASGTALDFLEQQNRGEGGKAAATRLIWDEVTEDPPSFLLGEGPAETVSRAAFMTTDRYLGEESPLRAFGLHPSEIATEAARQATALSGGRTSLNSALSSALGVFGDLGALGVAAFLFLLVRVVHALRKVHSAEAVAALAGWGMYALLGYVYDWWEQPPFSMTLAVLTGLALGAAARDRSESPVPSP